MEVPSLSRRSSSGLSAPSFKKSRTSLLRVVPPPPPREFFNISRADLIRAVPTKNFLHSPEVLSTSIGTDADYERSERCEQIGTFISHNWGCSGTMKWLGLVYHFHNRAVWFAALALVVLFEGLTIYFGWTTFEWRQVSSSGEVVVVGVFGPAVFCLPPIIALVFLLSARWTPACLLPEGGCFLDKCSISQTDNQLKSASIRQLGGYIAKSKAFLLVGEYGYLERLWCMYELAIFAAANNFSFDTLQTVQLDAIRWALFLFVFVTANNILAVPLMCSVFGSVQWNMWTLEAVPSALMRFMLNLSVFTLLLSGTVVFPMYVLYHVLQASEEQYGKLRERVKHFSVKRLRCTVEADRSFVIDEINKYFGDLDTFEQFVVDWLWPDFMERQYGRSRSSIVSYPLFMTAHMPHMIVALDFFLVTLTLRADDGERGNALCAFNLWMLGFVFVWIPVATRLATSTILWVRGLPIHSEKAKSMLAIGISTILYSLLCAFNVAVNPDIPQVTLTVIYTCMAVMIWYTW